jgi:hypothetical protein
MSENTLRIIVWCLLGVMLVLQIGNLIYEAIRSRRFYKRMEEQHNAFMKSLERDREQR